jgi:hypothetical protein
MKSVTIYFVSGSQKGQITQPQLLIDGKIVI